MRSALDAYRPLLVSLYRDEGFPTRLIAGLFGVSVDAVCCALERAGVERRPKGGVHGRTCKARLARRRRAVRRLVAQPTGARMVVAVDRANPSAHDLHIVAVATALGGRGFPFVPMEARRAA